jgi:endonuclease G
MNFILGLLLAFYSGSACPDHFWHGQEPTITRSQFDRSHDQVLCFQGFAVYHSGATLTPLWSAEHLTATAVDQAHEMERENDFHEEEALPGRYRSWLSDYRGHHGWDRGHQAPSGDMPNARAQWESFSLSNMCPQSSDNNRGLWERIERATRLLAQKEGEVYIITGPLFNDPHPQFDGRVRIPDHLWKLVFSPRQNAGAAYLTNNAPGDAYETLSIQQLEQLTGLKFPYQGVGILDLPKPKKRKSYDRF